MKLIFMISIRILLIIGYIIVCLSCAKAEENKGEIIFREDLIDLTKYK